MLRNVVVHINNEQPVLVDIEVAPQPSDVALICSNVRTMAGKKPVFVDHSDSTFVIPLAHIRLIELSKATVDAHEAEMKSEQERGLVPLVDDGPGPLARLDWLTGEGGGGAAAAADEAAETGPGEAAETGPGGAADSDDLDEHLLRRVRDA